MAGQLSNKGEDLMLRYLFNGTYAATLYVALSTTAVDDTTTLAGITEPTDTSYTSGGRKSITFGTPTLVNGGMQVANTNQIDYPAWTADATAKIAYAVITNASIGTTGDIIAWYALDTANQIQPLAGQPVKIPSGGVTLSLD